MTEQANKKLPLYRVTFSRIAVPGTYGSDVLSRPKEIGAVWARKDGTKGAILDLDIIPTDLVDRNGVIFLVPVEPKEAHSDNQAT